MKESSLIAAINRRLPKDFHSQSMTFGSLSFNGTPDRYYDPPGGFDLWVEYKYIDAMPRSKIVGCVNAEKRGCYSPLQYDWMLRRYTNSLAHGRPNVVGIIGLPNRTAVIQTTPAEWREGSSINNALPLEDIASWVRNFCFPASVSPARS